NIQMLLEAADYLE
nr:Chain B, MAD PROTEIN (MAX DIMERIZER) [Homo sapiens]